MMQEIYRKYLSALGAFVQGTAPEKPEPEELGKILELAKINSTWGIVSQAYLSNPGLLEQEANGYLRKQCFQEILLYARRAGQMKLLAQRLSENGIDCILFKGFVVREYYPVPELRTFGDVDFVIRREDREKCDALLLSMGFEAKQNWEPVYSYMKGTEYYEVHTHVMEIDVSDKADFTGYFSHIWEYVQPSSVVALPHVLEFKPEFHFLYLLTHIAKHISGSGAGIRMYLDIAFFVRHFGDSLDWDWVREELEKLCLKDFANVALTAVEQWFDVKSPIECHAVPEQIMEDFLEFTLTGGVYGYAGRDKSIVFLKQQNRNEEEISKFKTLLYHACPPAKVLENRYTYLQKHRWLLPVAWVQRLADSRKEWGRFADHTKNIITADETQAQKLKRLYKTIGL